ncbi:hypothetical protein KM043_011431 [Ampulex compressa]|nr:hypothetical protein KM043_011431 [Ampulex compressa]
MPGPRWTIIELSHSHRRYLHDNIIPDREQRKGSGLPGGGRVRDETSFGVVLVTAQAPCRLSHVSCEFNSRHEKGPWCQLAKAMVDLELDENTPKKTAVSRMQDKQQTFSNMRPELTVDYVETVEPRR